MRLLLGIAVAALSALPAAAGDVLLTGPVFSQIAGIILPDGFKIGYSDVKKDFFILEIMPEGETVDAWSEMVTLTANEALVSQGVKVSSYAGKMQELYRSTCPETFVSQEVDLGSFKVPGSLATRAVVMGCGEVIAANSASAGSEIVAMVIAEGKADMFTFQWAEHHSFPATAEMFSFEHWQGRLNRLLKAARLCPVVPGEAAPYPSCSE